MMKKRIKIALVFCILAFLETNCGNRVKSDSQSSYQDTLSYEKDNIPYENHHLEEAPDQVYKFTTKRINQDSLLNYCNNERALFDVSIVLKDSVIDDCNVWYASFDSNGNYTNYNIGVPFLKKGLLGEKVNFRFIDDFTGGSYVFSLDVAKLCQNKK